MTASTKRAKRTRVPSLTAGVEKAKAADARREEIKSFARDMVIACIAAGIPMIPEGEAMRQFVRASRVMHDEVYHPTKRSAKKVAATPETDDDAADDAELIDRQADELEEDDF